MRVPFGSRTPGAFPKIEEAKSAAAPVGQLVCLPAQRLAMPCAIGILCWFC